MKGYKRTVLRNGMRVITEAMPHVHSVSIGIWVDIGSRYEAAAESGICHFIEHMTFKGTKTRSAYDIASALESVGGSLNAFTSREQTCFYARVLDEHLPIAVDILTDMLMNSVFAPEQIERERNVIIEEINDVFDTPSDYVHDLFAKAVWDDHPLGQPIMGSTEGVSAMLRDKLVTFKDRNYTSERIVIAAAGNVDHDALFGMIDERLAFGDRDSQRPHEKPYPECAKPSRQAIRRDSNQTHTCIGFPAYHYAHPNKFSLLILHNILGGGMSSRLFQAVREELGYAYTVYTYQDFYRDGGVFGITLATDNKNAARSVDVILSEISKIQKNTILHAELESARQQLKGNLLLGLESTGARMNRLARHEFEYNEYVPVEESLRRVEAVTKDNLMEAISAIFSADRCAAVFLGSVRDKILDEIDWNILS
jgi:predicted Zn-dependent peptidase